MVLLDANQIFLIALLVVLAIVVYLELRFMRSRNKEYINQMMDKDDAYNTIATTKAIATSLKQKGRDIKEAELVIIQADNSYKRNNYIAARDSAKRAREILMQAPILEVAAPKTTEPALEEKSEEDHKTVHEVKKLEPHMLESRFIINACRGRIESAEGSGKDVSKAKDVLARAEKCFEDKKYDEALREGLKVRKMLGEETSETVEPVKDAVIVKVPRPEKKCERCSAGIGNDDVFCRKCGAPVVIKRSCAYCRADLDDGDAFCPKCGRKA
ncbi:MAG: zinc ribbon domain-containing protein [Methanomassiliicoccales archaeon]